jgi:hypothetical protein
VDLDGLRQWLGRHCIASMRIVTVTRRGGEKTQAFTLLRISQPDA